MEPAHGFRELGLPRGHLSKTRRAKQGFLWTTAAFPRQGGQRSSAWKLPWESFTQALDSGQKRRWTFGMNARGLEIRKDGSLPVLAGPGI